MNNLTVYCSQPASGQMATFLRAVEAAHHVVIRPIAELPAPDPLRRQALRVERAELLEAIARTEFNLAVCTNGSFAVHSVTALQSDLDALRYRLRAVNTVLGTEKGGPDNA